MLGPHGGARTAKSPAFWRGFRVSDSLVDDFDHLLRLLDQLVGGGGFNLFAAVAAHLFGERLELFDGVLGLVPREGGGGLVELGREGLADRLRQLQGVQVLRDLGDEVFEQLDRERRAVYRQAGRTRRAVGDAEGDGVLAAVGEPGDVELDLFVA